MFVDKRIDYNNLKSGINVPRKRFAKGDPKPKPGVQEIFDEFFGSYPYDERPKPTPPADWIDDQSKRIHWFDTKQGKQLLMASLNRADDQGALAPVSSKGILANLDTITDKLSTKDERSFYGGLLAPYYSQKFLNDMPLQDLKRLFEQWLNHQGY
jgi:hypothetical protein